MLEKQLVLLRTGQYSWFSSFMVVVKTELVTLGCRNPLPTSLWSRSSSTDQHKTLRYVCFCFKCTFLNRYCRFMNIWPLANSTLPHFWGSWSNTCLLCAVTARKLWTAAKAPQVLFCGSHISFNGRVNLQIWIHGPQGATTWRKKSTPILPSWINCVSGQSADEKKVFYGGVPGRKYRESARMSLL